MRKRLDKSGEAGIANQTNDFKLDFVKKAESGLKSTTKNMKAVLWRKLDLGLIRNWSIRILEKLTTSKGGTKLFRCILSNGSPLTLL